MLEKTLSVKNLFIFEMEVGQSAKKCVYVPMIENRNFHVLPLMQIKLGCED